MSFKNIQKAGKIVRYSTFPHRPSPPSPHRKVVTKPVCVLVSLFIITSLVFFFSKCSSTEDQDWWTSADSSTSKPKRKMAGVLTYEMGYLVWDPSPSGQYFDPLLGKLQDYAKC